jgi:hypothetical protein
MSETQNCRGKKRRINKKRKRRKIGVSPSIA